MKKISFDAEDFPPPSYYKRDMSEENEDTDELMGKFEDSKPLLEHPAAGNSMSRPTVHQSLKPPLLNGDNQKSEHKNKAMEKGDWWKAPEFVPRSARVVQLSTAAGYVTQQLPADATSSTETDLSKSRPSPPGANPTAPPVMRQPLLANAPMQPPRLTPYHMPLPIPGMGPGPAPAFIPLPLPPPPVSAVWPPVNGLNRSGAPVHQFSNAASLAVLHAQLARVHAHNPRLIRGGRQGQPHPNHQKFQQMLLRQQQHNQQMVAAQLHQQQRHQQLHGMHPNVPRGANGIPSGYKANMTTIDDGLGHPVPAIVLKRRRKKKSKKPAAGNASTTANAESINKQDLSLKNDGTKIQPDTASEYQAVEGSLKKRESSPDEDDDDTTTSCSLTSAHLAETRRSEPDLTKMQHHPNDSNAVCDVLIGTIGEEQCISVNGSNYPNDLDLIQSAMITGSCPDLSSDILVLNGNANVPMMTASMHINPFLRDNDFDDEEEFQTATISPVQLEHKTGHQRKGDSNQVFHADNEFEMDTNPVVKTAMLDLASEGMIRSQQVKQLNRQVIKDMRLEEKVRNWRNEDWSDPEMEEDDTIFDRLLKKDEYKPKGPQKQQETNPGRGQKSLREELEEGMLMFRNRGAKDYDRLNQNDDEDSRAVTRKLMSASVGAGVFDGDEDSIAPVHTAIVHGGGRRGDKAQTELYDDEDFHHSRKHGGKSTIPRATYVEDDIDDERMRITVNALDVEGSDALLSKASLNASGESSRPERATANTHNIKRRFSFPEAVPLVPLTNTRHCCALM